MNSAVVMFLSTVDKDNELVQSGLVINDQFVSVLHLYTPAKKVILSNVPPFISDELIAQELSWFGKLVCPIKKIPLGCKSPLVKHFVLFGRLVFMVLRDDKEELQLVLKLRVKGFEYMVFVSSDTSMKCFRCGLTRHLVRACLEKLNANTGDAGSAEQPGPAAAEPAVAIPPALGVSVRAALATDEPFPAALTAGEPAVNHPCGEEEEQEITDPGEFYICQRRKGGKDLSTWLAGPLPSNSSSSRDSSLVWRAVSCKTLHTVGAGSSLHWLLDEPLFHGTRLDLGGTITPTLTRVLLSSGVTTLRQLLDIAGPGLARVEDVPVRLGMRALRVVAQLLEGWRTALSPEERKQVRDYSAGVFGPTEHDPFPDINITLDLQDCEGPLLECAGESVMSFGTVSAQRSGNTPGETQEELGLETNHSAQKLQVTQALNPRRTSEHRRVKWPQAYKELKWLQFDEDADTILEAIAKGDADQRLQNMTTIIISLAAERFGLEKKRTVNLPYTMNNRSKKIH
ncbi:hypothetical protein AOLI_G00046600 [Acnodon oligacanthus]